MTMMRQLIDRDVVVDPKRNWEGPKLHKLAYFPTYTPKRVAKIGRLTRSERGDLWHIWDHFVVLDVPERYQICQICLRYQVHNRPTGNEVRDPDSE